MLKRATFWLRVGGGFAVGAVVGVAALVLAPPVYESSTSVLVEPVGAEVNMGTEAELVRSTRIAADAAARLTSDPTNPAPGGRLVDVRPLPGTSVLVIIFEAASAVVARDGAAAYAQAYLAGRAEVARTSLNDQIVTVQRQLDDVGAQLTEVNALLRQIAPDSPDATSLRATQESLSAQSAALSAQLSALQTTTVNPGRIVAQAQLPTTPARPNRALWLGLALGLGTLGGAGLDLGRTRWSPRLTDRGDLRRHRITLLADLAPAALLASGGHQDPHGRAFNRLRNEVDAALTPADHILLVTGAAPGGASTLVAASLAAAFARADSEVVLVGASVPDLESAEAAVTLASLFDLADIPGLTDVLAGRTTLAKAVQRAARSPRLTVVTPGGTASSAGLLQSEGARSVLRQLATRNRYVIVDAPSTAAGADAQSLAGAADVALLVVEAGHAQHAQVADAVTQLDRVGTRLLGAVLVPARTAGSPYGSRAPGGAVPFRLGQPGSGRRERPVPAAGAGYDTEAWIENRSGPLDGPTRKLEIVKRRPPERVRAPLEADPPAPTPAP